MQLDRNVGPDDPAFRLFFAFHVLVYGCYIQWIPVYEKGGSAQHWIRSVVRKKDSFYLFFIFLILSLLSRLDTRIVLFITRSYLSLYVSLFLLPGAVTPGDHHPYTPSLATRLMFVFSNLMLLFGYIAESSFQKELV